MQLSGNVQSYSKYLPFM
uniref:Uncharacterized protein n=1 Tax=Anguilla anguilla TaxID=7936 RepID=A0A0E9T1E9_ANGAN